jgi:hypothetical protein
MIARIPIVCPLCGAPLTCSALLTLPGCWQYECGSLYGHEAASLGVDLPQTTGLCVRRQVEALQRELERVNRLQDRRKAE